MTDPLLMVLPDIGVWQTVLVRSAGFPTDVLTGLSNPRLAAAVDGARPATDLPDHLAAAVDESFFAQGQELARAGSGGLLEEALTWQNRPALSALTRVSSDGPRNRKRRKAIRTLARYWQRYCAKSESIGFFGPVAWTELSDEVSGIQVKPGENLVRRRWVCWEDWAISQLAATLNADPAFAAELPLQRPSYVGLRGDGAGAVAVIAGASPLRLTELETRLLRDGAGRAVPGLAVDLVADGAARTTDDVAITVDAMVSRGLLIRGFQVSSRPTAMRELHDQVDRIGDDGLRASAQRTLEVLEADLRAVATAAGDATAVRTALQTLDERFVEHTSVAASHHHGQTYAGRSLCYEDSTRELNLRIGMDVVRSVADPLRLVILAASWFCAALAQAYERICNELFDDLEADAGGGPVPLSDLLFLVTGTLFGGGDRPLDDVQTELVRRWTQLIGPGNGSEPLRAADLMAEAERLFPVPPSPWPAATFHCPDLQFVTSEPARTADCHVVLGELHAGWATFDSYALLAGADNLEQLRAAAARDLGQHRVRLLPPPGWPRTTGRLTEWLTNPGDRLLAFTSDHVVAPTTPSSPELLRSVDLVVRRTEVGLLATELTPEGEGRSWPMLELLADLLAIHSVDAFKFTSTDAHQPRVTIDRLIVTREQWRSDCAATGVVDTADCVEQYVALRRWRGDNGFPERVFVKLGTEVKPVYLDFTSPVLVSSVAAMIRSAALEHGATTTLTVSELLPDLDANWLPDADGHRYVSEVRLQCRYLPGGNPPAERAMS